MRFAELTLSLIVLLLYISHGTAAGNCDGIKYITIEDPRRSTAFDARNTSYAGKQLCDRDVIKDGSWYRFSSEAGEEIPTSPPRFYSCGTHGSIWMNGSHPTVEEGKVSRKACVKVPYTIPINCTETINIGVLNCSGYYIYQLWKPDRCDVAYCAGSKAPNCTQAASGIVCPANLPPHFTMLNKRFYAIENRELQVQISARDPEAHQLKYSLLLNGTIKSGKINKWNGLLKLTTDKSGTVYVKVADVAGSQSILALQIITKHCPCKNGGKCVWNKLPTNPLNPPSSNGCNCTQAFIGVLCESKAACENLPCFPGVQCTSTADGKFTCGKCPEQFEGDGINCKLKPNVEAACENLPCFPGLQCTPTADGKFTCGKCPEQFEGDGINCKLRPDVGKFTVAVQMRIFGGIVWKDELKNKNSLYYKHVTVLITEQIKQIYANIEGFVYIIITGYRRGSVVVEFDLLFTKKIDEPLKPLVRSNEKNHGKLGNWTVKQKDKEPPVSSKPNDKILGVQKTVFIVIVVIVSLVALTAIVAVAICMRKKKLNIIMLSVGDDRAEIYPRSQSSQVSIRKPSQNQVVDISCVKNKAFVGQ